MFQVVYVLLTLIIDSALLEDILNSTSILQLNSLDNVRDSGTTCGSNAECGVNAYCSSFNQCQCNSGYVRDPDHQNYDCYKPLDSYCQSSTECSDYAICKGLVATCQCISGYEPYDNVDCESKPSSLGVDITVPVVVIVFLIILILGIRRCCLRRRALAAVRAINANSNVYSRSYPIQPSQSGQFTYQQTIFQDSPRRTSLYNLSRSRQNTFQDHLSRSGQFTSFQDLSESRQRTFQESNSNRYQEALEPNQSCFEAPPPYPGLSRQSAQNPAYSSLPNNNNKNIF